MQTMHNVAIMDAVNEQINEAKEKVYTPMQKQASVCAHMPSPLLRPAYKWHMLDMNLCVSAP